MHSSICLLNGFWGLCAVRCSLIRCHTGVHNREMHTWHQATHLSTKIFMCARLRTDLKCNVSMPSTIITCSFYANVFTSLSAVRCGISYEHNMPPNYSMLPPLFTHKMRNPVRNAEASCNLQLLLLPLKPGQCSVILPAMWLLSQQC
jgi:hypothetical protein